MIHEHIYRQYRWHNYVLCRYASVYPGGASYWAYHRINPLVDFPENYPDGYKGIPLTPVILDNYIPDAQPVGADYNINGIAIYSAHDNFFVILDGQHITINYLHELQNLYSLYTARELEIKELPIKKITE